MKTQIRLILSAIALTVLIWTYADRAGQDIYITTLPLQVTPPADEGNPFVFRLPDGDRNDEPGFLCRAELTLRGPKSAVARVQKDDNQGRLQFTVVIHDELAPGARSLNLFDALSRSPVIRDRGLLLQSVSPEKIEFQVDRYKNLTVEVKPVAGLYEDDLVGRRRPIVEPSKVVARVLESQLEGRSELPPLSLFLGDAIAEELHKRSDQIDETAGTLTLRMTLNPTWAGIDATFYPEKVEVTVELERTTVTEHIAPIPLHVTVKPGFFDRYEVVWEDETGAVLTQDIEVRAPSDKADQLKNLKGSDVVAYVIIGDSDLPEETAGPTGTAPANADVGRSWRERQVQFVFPPGFEEVKPIEPLPKVKFRVRKKAEPAGPGMPNAPFQ